MDETGKKLLGLMFRDGETVCVSPNQFGCHGIPLENAKSGTVTLLPPNPEHPTRYCDSSELLLVALNPIKGQREDANCTAYRNFLVELDSGPIKEQKAYVKRMGMPYSAIVFSGNKSLHFLISLENDLSSEKEYRKISEWILAAMPMADQMTKNPSRSIRIPGAYREPGKKQILVEIKGPVKLSDLAIWLNRFPDAKPKARVKRTPSDTKDLTKLKPWVRRVLENGLDPSKGRNQSWYAIAYEFALTGASEGGTVDMLERYFTPDHDFKEKEWRAAIRSAFKSAYKRGSP